MHGFALGIAAQRYHTRVIAQMELRARCPAVIGRRLQMSEVRQGCACTEVPGRLQIDASGRGEFFLVKNV